jgi:hypothetical protein
MTSTRLYVYRREFPVTGIVAVIIIFFVAVFIIIIAILVVVVFFFLHLVVQGLFGAATQFDRCFLCAMKNH